MIIPNHEPPKYEFTISGFIIALLLCAALLPAFALFSAGVSETYNLTTNTTLGQYNRTMGSGSAQVDLINLSREIRNGTDLQQQAGVLDVIGGYFSKAVAAIKITLASFNYYIFLSSQAEQDVPYLGQFMDVLTAILVIMLFVGVVIAAYLKWKV